MNGNSRPVDVVLRHGHIVSLDRERRIFVDGAIAIDAGLIVDIGHDRDIASSFRGTDERDLSGAIVHPGFVDAHAHTGLDLIRGLTPDGTRDWTGVEDPFFASLSPDRERLATLLACMEMVANGVTTYADTGSSLNLAATVDAIETVGLRGIPGQFIADLPLEVEGLHRPTVECLQRLRDQITRYPLSERARVHCAVSIAGMGTCSDDLLIASKAMADETGLPLIMHQSWGNDEVEASLAQIGRRPIEHLSDLGLLDQNVTLVHMIHVNLDEIALVAQAGANVVHCPGASIRRAMGAMRSGKFPDMLQAGIVVALGSDGHSGKHDLARQAFLAATLHREVRDAIPTISAETALEMATVSGAQAVGMERQVGSLEPGKYADVVIHRQDRPETRPRFRNPVQNLVYHALGQTVDSVLVGGEFIFENGRFTRFNQEEVYRQLDAVALTLEDEIAPVWRKCAWPVL
ncbi:MAG: amidohydrolase family protein [Thermomicrobiales bacterium]|nr:amidohydrolase family protein [Thermomicrobiales bacterium]